MTLSEAAAREAAQRWRRRDASADEVEQLLLYCRARLAEFRRDGRPRDRVDLACALGSVLDLSEGLGVDGVASVRLAKLAGYPGEQGMLGPTRS